MIRTNEILDTEPVKKETISSFLERAKVDRGFDKVVRHQTDVTDFLLESLRELK